jgi:hypothetical protein
VPLLWNTPAPPNLDVCRAYTNHVNWCPFFYAVDMNQVRGITFLFSPGTLVAIHVHRSEDSCATEVYNTRNPPNRHNHVWIYVPISEKDHPLLLGLQNNQSSKFQSILIRTKLVGDIVVGIERFESPLQRYVFVTAPVTMVYGTPKNGYPVRFFGAYNKELPDPDPAHSEPFPRYSHYGDYPLGSRAHYSCAPLGSVSSVRVFYDPSTGCCRGILFHYYNGGTRAVGQCRVNVDPTKDVSRPTRLRFLLEEDHSPTRTPRLVRTVRVRFVQDPVDGNAEGNIEGWETRPMEGSVAFWVNHHSAFMIVKN